MIHDFNVIIAPNGFVSIWLLVYYTNLVKRKILNGVPQFQVKLCANIKITTNADD